MIAVEGDPVVTLLLLPLWLLTALLVAVVGYYWLLASIALFTPRRRAPRDREPSRNSFVVLIPAHDEERGLPETLQSCAALDYPSDSLRVMVIADNCTDATAAVAGAHGVECLERADAARTGKGYALEWGFRHVLPGKPDAILVIDADCRLDPHALRVFDRYLSRGAEVLQANDVATNPDDSPLSYVAVVGNRIENEFFYAPKSRLGLAVFLRGTGMVFRKEVLEVLPWDAHSIVEDVEYTLRLIRRGKRVVFVREAGVRSAFPATAPQLRAQRLRWASGNLQFGRREGFRLLWEGLLKRNLLIADAGLTLLVLSRPAVLCASALSLLLAGIGWAIRPSVGTSGLWWTNLLLSGVLIAYFSLGVWSIGLTARRVRLLAEAPVAVGRLAILSLAGLIGVGRDRWTRTPRS